MVENIVTSTYIAAAYAEQAVAALWEFLKDRVWPPSALHFTRWRPLKLMAVFRKSHRQDRVRVDGLISHHEFLPPAFPYFKT